MVLGYPIDILKCGDRWMNISSVLSIFNEFKLEDTQFWRVLIIGDIQSG